MTDDYRFFSEQVSHHPPITAYYQEGKGYRAKGFLHQKSKMGFGGGRGLMLVNQLGYQDYYFEKYDEWISINRPQVMACNLIIGSMYIDVEGDVEAVNNKTGERADIKFNTRGWSVESTLDCKIYDAHGSHVYNIEGSWLNRLYLVSCATG